MTVSERRLWRRLQVVGGVVGLMLIIFPPIDLGIARLFFRPDSAHMPMGFVLGEAPWAHGVHEAVQWASKGLAVVLTVGFLYCAVRLRRLWGLGTKQWLFLVLALAIGPGVVANLLFKDEWGRARPAQIQAFGGTKQFTPPLVLSHQCDHNCSFVSGDASAGFFVHTFAYVARRRQRTVFYGGIAVGALIGVLRMAQGAHFFSDVLFAGVFMIAASAAAYALVYGRGAVMAWWRDHIVPH